MGPDSLHGCDPVVEPYRYDGYGAVTVLDADWSVDGDSLSDVDNPYVFTGRRLDAESGLMQYRNRYYDAVLGRFLTRDPAGYRDGADMYVYAASRPTIGADPEGEGVIIMVIMIFVPVWAGTKFIKAVHKTVIYVNPCLQCTRRRNHMRDLAIERGYYDDDLRQGLQAMCSTVCSGAIGGLVEIWATAPMPSYKPSWLGW